MVGTEFPALLPAGLDAKFQAAVNVFAGAGVAGDGHALAAGEVVAVARQFDGRARGMATVEQPAEVGDGGAVGGQLPGGKEPLVLRSETPVYLMPRHGEMEFLVRIAGLEPARLAALPPQSSVSANSTICAPAFIMKQVIAYCAS